MILPFKVLYLLPFLFLGDAFTAKRATVNHPFRTVSHQRRSASKLSSSFNPNDLETPEERDARMKLVRQLQKMYYQNSNNGSNSVDGIDELGDGLCSPAKDDPRILHNVPLWRVQWTELPGFQNVLNCHVPHYTHMFRTILSCEDKQKWIFGHVFLEGGSENLGNDAFKLPDSASADSKSRATLTGTLLRVSDYIEQDDGRLTLIVQALNQRFTILEASQHLPYAIATVRLDPDEEILEKYDGNAPKAIEEAYQYQEWEFRPTVWEDTEHGGEKIIGGVSPLVNYNAQVDMPKIAFDDIKTQQKLLGSDDNGDEDLFEQLQGDAPMATESIDHIIELEVKVWLALDLMLRLLAKINPGLRIPVPTQLLGLLPCNVEWNDQFQLEDFCEQLESKQIGSTSKSDFVRLPPEADPLRRASRLSYVVWILFDSIRFDDGSSTMTKQAILEEASISKRLECALQQFDVVNTAIQKVLDDVDD